MAEPQNDLVVIDNSMITGLLRDSALVSMLPACFSNVTAPMQSGCGNCGGAVGPQIDFDRIKTCITLLDSSAMNVLKSYLNTKRIRVFYPAQKGGKSVVIQYTR